MLDHPNIIKKYREKVALRSHYISDYIETSTMLQNGVEVIAKPHSKYDSAYFLSLGPHLIEKHWK